MSRTLSLKDSLIRAFAHLWPNTHVNLLISSLHIVRALSHLGLVHVQVVLRVPLVAHGTHQNIIGFVARFFHLAVGTH